MFATHRPRGIAAPGLVVLICFLGSGCRYKATLPGAQPVPGTQPPSAQAEGPEPRAVRYEVFCQKCDVAYTTGTDLGRESVEGTWSTVVRMQATGVGVLMLNVTPTNAGGFVRRAAIFVDNRLLAQEKRNGRGASIDQVQLTARMPSTR
jgi:hypothetical protein